MKTNNLTFRTNKISKGQHIFVTIRLNDECKNGHQDFAITANIYEAGKPNNDRYLLSAGCCHDEILRAFPQFKQFIDLHLCDYLGNPTHTTANGFYHLRNGFNNTPSKDPDFKAKYCEYYRITESQFESLLYVQNKIQFALKLIELEIPKQWKKQADEAIKALEELTGNEFLVDSVKNQFGMPSDEAIREEQDKIKEGYYSIDAISERRAKDNAAFIDKIKQDSSKQINSIKKERDIKIMLFKMGGKRLFENVIYYKHSNKISFNWRGYGEIIELKEAQNFYNKIIEHIQLDGFEMK